MEIRVSHDEPPTLIDPDVLDRFEVVVQPGLNAPELLAALASIGAPTDDLEHVYVNPAWVSAQAQTTSTDPDWQGAWQGVVRYAEDKGWTDAAGRVRAHVEVR